MGQVTAHDAVISVMREHGEYLLAEYVDDVLVEHQAEEDSWRCRACFDAQWPCSEWMKSNDRVVRWLLDRVRAGER